MDLDGGSMGMSQEQEAGSNQDEELAVAVFRVFDPFHTAVSKNPNIVQ